MLGVLSSLGEQRLDDRTAGWAKATAAAGDNGIPIACKGPIGYLRADEVDPRYPARGG